VVKGRHWRNAVEEISTNIGFSSCLNTEFFVYGGFWGTSKHKFLISNFLFYFFIISNLSLNPSFRYFSLSLTSEPLLDGRPDPGNPPQPDPMPLQHQAGQPSFLAADPSQSRQERLHPSETMSVRQGHLSDEG
jgi:hypothetical protein